jgi:hypothetical protein
MGLDARLNTASNMRDESSAQGKTWQLARNGANACGEGVWDWV